MIQPADALRGMASAVSCECLGINLQAKETGAVGRVSGAMASGWGWLPRSKVIGIEYMRTVGVCGSMGEWAVGSPYRIDGSIFFRLTHRDDTVSACDCVE